MSFRSGLPYPSGALCSSAKQAEAVLQQFRYVLLRHFPDEPRLHILVVMHHNVASTNKA